MVNHILYLNQTRENPYPLDYLDIYSDKSEDSIVGELIIEGGESRESQLDFYQ